MIHFDYAQVTKVDFSRVGGNTVTRWQMDFRRFPPFMIAKVCLHLEGYAENKYSDRSKQVPWEEIGTCSVHHRYRLSHIAYCQGS